MKIYVYPIMERQYFKGFGPKPMRYIKEYAGFYKTHTKNVDRNTAVVAFGYQVNIRKNTSNNRS